MERRTVRPRCRTKASSHTRAEGDVDGVDGACVDCARVDCARVDCACALALGCGRVGCACALALGCGYDDDDDDGAGCGCEEARLDTMHRSCRRKAGTKREPPHSSPRTLAPPLSSPYGRGDRSRHRRTFRCNVRGPMSRTFRWRDHELADRTACLHRAADGGVFGNAEERQRRDDSEMTKRKHSSKSILATVSY